MTGPLLTFCDIRKTYGPQCVLDNVSISLNTGEALALTGESGSGKSTLLHLAGGLDHADAGEIWLDGTELGHLSDTQRAMLRRDKLGLIFQQFNLVPSLNVAANIALQAKLAGRYDRRFADALASRLGLSNLQARYPEELSGGQQQRVAIARALAARPTLILADEPTGNLDEETSDTVLSLFLDLVQDSGSALLMVTHSLRLAQRLGARIHLSRGRLIGED